MELLVLISIPPVSVHGLTLVQLCVADPYIITCMPALCPSCAPARLLVVELVQSSWHILLATVRRGTNAKLDQACL